MAVYIVTGKLGSGKTLLACMKAQEYLKRRCPVASNVEFNLEVLCKPTNNYSRFVRLPDMPTADDLIMLGMGCDKYDEERFGAIFLDEAGIWLNSRKWNSSGRTDLLEFFLYLRKRRWDLWLIVQNIDIVDKQIRAAIAEHVVYCSRSDRFQLPIVPKLILNVITLGMINFIRMPKFHSAICKYGVSRLSPTADTWYYRGVDFYHAYNTMQQFDENYSAGCFSVLPPAYTLPIKKLRRQRFRDYLLYRPLINPIIPPPKCVNNKAMRLTKIYFRKTKAFLAFGSGLFTALSVCFLLYVFVLKPANNSVSTSASIPASANTVDASEYESLLANTKVDFVNYFPGVGYRFGFVSGEKKFSSDDLINKNFTVMSSKGFHEFKIKNLSTGRVYLVTQ